MTDDSKATKKKEVTTIMNTYVDKKSAIAVAFRARDTVSNQAFAVLIDGTFIWVLCSVFVALNASSILRIWSGAHGTPTSAAEEHRLHW